MSKNKIPKGIIKATPQQPDEVFTKHCERVATMDWQVLEKTILGCVLCDLHKSRTHAVPGVGNKKAKIVFVGEGPGANEDLQGEPFVGRAGKLLNEMLAMIGLKRSDVYITNVVKCRPPKNRTPLPSEVKTCTPYLQRQIAMLKPKLVVALGRVAAQYLLDTKESMINLRGKVHKFGDTEISLIVTYHPAYLLRAPQEKPKSYQDFQLIASNCSINPGSKL